MKPSENGESVKEDEGVVEDPTLWGALKTFPRGMMESNLFSFSNVIGFLSAWATLSAMSCMIQLNAQQQATIAKAKQDSSDASALVEKMESQIVKITSMAHFKDIIGNSNVPVMADFNTDWCGPCKIMGPIIEKFAIDNKGKILVVSIDTDELSELAKEYEIKGVPAFLVFQNAKVVGRFGGLQEEEKFEGEIDKILEEQREKLKMLVKGKTPYV